VYLGKKITKEEGQQEENYEEAVEEMSKEK
jgi:hypothetical protein